jgi:high-affinity iron transporter
MAFSLLVTAREGLEMALIITILLGYLRSIDQKQHFRQIWYGVVGAAALSIAFGAALKLASSELDGRVLEAFEGFTMLFAVAVLTWMLFWMKAQSSGISRQLSQQVNVALSRGSMLALALLAFSAVGREGFETALFLFAGSTNEASTVNGT